MKITIHQPNYWPWLGLLDKIAKTKLYVVLDDVPTNKASNQYRNKFFCNGQQKILTLPVDYRMGIHINELRLKNNRWKDEHLSKLKNYYLKAPYFKEIFPLVENTYTSFESEYAFDFVMKTIKLLFYFFNIKTKLIKSSKLNTTQKKGELVLEICKKVKANNYLSGQGARDYMTEELIKRFKDERINLVWHHFIHPIYPQHKKYVFVTGLAGLDILFWNGIEKSREIFWENVNKKDIK